MPLAPFSISTKTAVATSQKELDALARGPIGGDPFSGPSASAMKNMKQGVGVEGLLASGLDRVMAAGLQAGAEGDYEAASVAKEFISSQIDTPEVKKAMAAAISYTGEPGRDPAKDILRDQAKKFYGSGWQLDLAKLASPTTNPRASEFTYKETVAELGANGGDPVSLTRTLNEKWEKAKAVARGGSVSRAASMRRGIQSTIANNDKMLRALMTINPNSPDAAALAPLIETANKFGSYKFMSEDAALFSVETNPMAKEYQKSEAMKRGLSKEAAEAEVDASHGDVVSNAVINSARGVAESTMKQGKSAAAIPGTNPLADLNTSVGAIKPFASKIKTVVKSDEEAANVVTGTMASLAGVPAQDLPTVLDSIGGVSDKIDPRKAAKAYSIGHSKFVQSFEVPTADPKTRQFDAISAAQLSDVTPAMFNVVASKVASEATPTGFDPVKTRGERTVTEMNRAVATADQLRPVLGNAFVSKNAEAIAKYSMGDKDDAQAVMVGKVYDASRKLLDSVTQTPSINQLNDPRLQNVSEALPNTFKSMLSAAVSAASSKADPRQDFMSLVSSDAVVSEVSQMFMAGVPGVSQKEAFDFTKKMLMDFSEAAKAGKPINPAQYLSGSTTPGKIAREPELQSDEKILAGAVARPKSGLAKLFGVDRPGLIGANLNPTQETSIRRSVDSIKREVLSAVITAAEKSGAAPSRQEVEAAIAGALDKRPVSKVLVGTPDRVASMVDGVLAIIPEARKSVMKGVTSAGLAIAPNRVDDIVEAAMGVVPALPSRMEAPAGRTGSAVSSVSTEAVDPFDKAFRTALQAPTAQLATAIRAASAEKPKAAPVPETRMTAADKLLSLYTSKKEAANYEIMREQTEQAFRQIGSILPAKELTARLKFREAVANGETPEKAFEKVTSEALSALQEKKAATSGM